MRFNIDAKSKRVQRDTRDAVAGVRFTFRQLRYPLLVNKRYQPQHVGCSYKKIIHSFIQFYFIPFTASRINLTCVPQGILSLLSQYENCQ